MSLINQMLRDLEQRRTAEAGSSPLGGLSASGIATQSVNFPINYATLAIAVAAVFVVGVLVAYFLGSQQQISAITNTDIPFLEKKLLVAEEKVSEKFVVAPVEEVDILKSSSEEIMISKSIISKPVIPEVMSSKSVVETTTAEPLSVIFPREVEISKSDTLVISEIPTPKDAIKEPVEKVTKVVVADAPIESSVEETPVKSEENINKTIIPLTAEQRSQVAFQRAIALLSRGSQQAAQLALEESLSIAPTHIRARETLAALLLNEGRVSEAASSLRNGLQLMPDVTPLAKLYARILVDQGDISDAVSVLKRARPRVAADPEYHALLAALYRQEKKHAQAARVYQQILIQRPGVASWWLGLALSQGAMGENEKALDAFQRAMRVGGLGKEVTKYMRARIIALTSLLPVAKSDNSEPDEFGE